MAIGLNQVQLIGNVGREPEIRTTGENKEMVTFSLATSDSRRDRNSKEKKEKTEWHKIVVFQEGIVGIVKSYVRKGTKLYIQGSLRTREWKDNNGIKRYITEIVLQTPGAVLVLLDNKHEYESGLTKSEPHSEYSDSANTFNNNELDDDIPF